MTPDQASGQAQVFITVSHSPLAYIYALFTPTIAINGERHRRPWGTHRFSLPAGEYVVEISYPWVFSPECGKNSVRVTLQAGDTRKIVYKAGLIRYLPGKISAE